MMILTFIVNDFSRDGNGNATIFFNNNPDRNYHHCCHYFFIGDALMVYLLRLFISKNMSTMKASVS